MTSLTADAVLMTKFQPTKFRQGYDQDQVDDFLDTVTAILRSHEAGGPFDAVAAAELCRTARFRPTKLREGYDQQQVDDLLARLAQQFSTLAGGASPGSGTVATPSSSGPRPGEHPISRRPAVGTVVGVVAAVAALVVLVWQYVL